MKRIAIVGLLVTLAVGPARADNPRDWFVEMKRAAKELRIAAHAGNEPVIGGSRATIYAIAARAGFWTMGSVPAQVAETCRTASNTLLEAAEAAKRQDASSYSASFRRYMDWEGICFDAIVKGEATARAAAR